jgi:general secretion pathway protein N
MTCSRSSRGVVLMLWCTSMLGAVANAQSSEQTADNLANPLQAQSLDRLAVTRDRPLFSPSRRPVPPPPPPVERAPEAAPPPPAPNVTVVGIVIDAEGAHAIVRSGTAPIERLQIGDVIGGWKVSQIEGRRLVLSLDDRSATFTMFSDESGKRPPDDPASLQDQRNQAQAQQAAQSPPASSRRHRRP